MAKKKQDYWFYGVIILTICLGIFFRVTNLGQKVYWHDEAHTSLRVAGYNSEQVIDRFFTGEIITAQDLLEVQQIQPEKNLGDAMVMFSEHPEHPPLYYILQRFWQQLFGSNIATARSLSALFGILLLPAIYWFAWQLFGCPKTALISTALVAIAPVHLLYAQEARQYSLWTLATVLNSIFFLKAIQENTFKNWVLYLLTWLLNLYTSLISVFLLLVHFVYLILQKNYCNLQIWARFVLTSSIGIILFIPWLVVIFVNYTDMKNATDWLKQEKSFSSLFNSWSVNLSHIFADFSWSQYNRWSDFFVLLSFLLVIYSCFYLIRNTPKKTWLYLILFAVLPFATLMITDLLFGSIRSTVNRYLIAYFVGIELIVSYCLSQKIFLKKSRVWSVISLLIVLAGIFSSWDLIHADTWWNKGLGYHNKAIADVINQEDKPLVIMEESGIATGLMISLSHNLHPDTALQLVPDNDQPLNIYERFNPIFVIKPSPELTRKVETAYNTELVDTYEQYYFSNPSLYKMSNE